MKLCGPPVCLPYLRALADTVGSLFASGEPKVYHIIVCVCVDGRPTCLLELHVLEVISAVFGGADRARRSFVFEGVCLSHSCAKFFCAVLLD